MKRKVAVVGSTGSIGKNTLKAAKHLGIEVTALSAKQDIKLLEEQIREFKPRIAAVFDYDAAKSLKTRVADTSTKIEYGEEGINFVACEENSDISVIALVGMVGLKPTLAALKCKKDIAFVNKETLVVGGKLVTKTAKENKKELIPVDSELSAMFQCLGGTKNIKEVKKLILTASGGPFFGKNKNELQNMKPSDALKHPNWDMGAKVTIDSATMMNKGLEVIETAELFGIPEDKIEVVVHRESIIHSAVQFCDNSVLAQLGVPDMEIPIQYALTWPERKVSLADEIDLIKLSKLSFNEPDNETFPCLNACRRMYRKGGLNPAFLNAVNEETVKAFLEEKIEFTKIGEIIDKLSYRDIKGELTLDNICAADKLGREEALKEITKR